jgi:hypothetical protein
MKKTAGLMMLMLLAGCSAEPGSERWCEAKKGEPKSEWSMEDAKTYAKNCVIEGMAIGSEEWCEDMDKTPKGEWSANDAKSYAKHCVVN